MTSENKELEKKFVQDYYDGKRNQADQKHGFGRLTTTEYDYEGEWSEDLRHGFGKIKYKKGDYYEGDWEHDKKNGRGKLIEKKLFGVFAETYEGEFRDDQKEGEGRQELKSGLVYTGQFLAGKFHGEGKLEDQANKYSYKGRFLNGKQHGRGTEKYVDGSSYEGSFLNGLKHGKGEYKNSLGYSYLGDWACGVKQGYGVEMNSGDSPQIDRAFREQVEKKFVYEGQFWNNARHGRGKLILASEIFAGGFVHGKLNGVVCNLKSDGSWKRSVYRAGVESAENSDGQIDGAEKKLKDIWLLYHNKIRALFPKLSSAEFVDEEFLQMTGNYFSMDPLRIPSKSISFEGGAGKASFIRLYDIHPRIQFEVVPVAPAHPAQGPAQGPAQTTGRAREARFGVPQSELRRGREPEERRRRGVGAVRRGLRAEQSARRAALRIPAHAHQAPRRPRAGRLGLHQPAQELLRVQPVLRSGQVRPALPRRR